MAIILFIVFSFSSVVASNDIYALFERYNDKTLTEEVVLLSLENNCLARDSISCEILFFIRVAGLVDLPDFELSKEQLKKFTNQGENHHLFAFAKYSDLYENALKMEGREFQCYKALDPIEIISQENCELSQEDCTLAASIRMQSSNCSINKSLNMIKVDCTKGKGVSCKMLARIFLGYGKSGLFNPKQSQKYLKNYCNEVSDEKCNRLKNEIKNTIETSCDSNRKMCIDKRHENEGCFRDSSELEKFIKVCRGLTKEYLFRVYYPPVGTKNILRYIAKNIEYFESCFKGNGEECLNLSVGFYESMAHRSGKTSSTIYLMLKSCFLGFENACSEACYIRRKLPALNDEILEQMSIKCSPQNNKIHIFE